MTKKIKKLTPAQREKKLAQVNRYFERGMENSEKAAKLWKQLKADDKLKNKKGK